MGDATPIRCRACGGHPGSIACRWCLEGWMTPEQFGAWMRFKSGPRAAVAGPPPPTSTQPYDAHQIVMLDRIARAWGKARAMRLGELLVEALALGHMTPGALATLDDARLAEIIERYVLFDG